MRIRQTPSSLLTLRHPAGRGSELSARTAATMRFLTGLSSRLNSRSAHEVMVTLDIYLAGGAHLFDNLRESAARFIPALAVDATQMQVFQHLLVLFNRKNHGG